MTCWSPCCLCVCVCVCVCSLQQAGVLKPAAERDAIWTAGRVPAEGAGLRVSVSGGGVLESLFERVGCVCVCVCVSAEINVNLIVF